MDRLCFSGLILVGIFVLAGRDLMRWSILGRRCSKYHPGLKASTFNLGLSAPILSL